MYFLSTQIASCSCFLALTILSNHHPYSIIMKVNFDLVPPVVSCHEQHQSSSVGLVVVHSVSPMSLCVHESS